ncbi:hypothetical protein J3R30DRAFT_201899 [Lentinula aciculospora]|uniref:UBZ4-type domain-containing protein n=1 Tax=Lentinula aciculospora TaxID=153920 RepID=A0A9W9A9Z6_9AGAR|nr:hypothetical protein J3R30DRAFT_201899 [Lentinula aciculospora]
MIQRPRNRQRRRTQKPARGGGSQRDLQANGASNHLSSLVPTARQVVFGAHVSIILKIDQPTGRQVQGTVTDVLTNGDHPRGIKVRLVDGRVGRVQRMVSEAEARAGSEGSGNLGRDREPIATYHPATLTNQSRSPAHKEPGMIAAPVMFNLGDFLPHDAEEERECGQDLERTSCHPVITQTCPVCYEFDGDEAAIAHHLDSHFA